MMYDYTKWDKFSPTIMLAIFVAFFGVLALLITYPILVLIPIVYMIIHIGYLMYKHYV